MDAPPTRPDMERSQLLARIERERAAERRKMRQPIEPPEPYYSMPLVVILALVLFMTALLFP